MSAAFSLCDHVRFRNSAAGETPDNSTQLCAAIWRNCALRNVVQTAVVDQEIKVAAVTELSLEHLGCNAHAESLRQRL